MFYYHTVVYHIFYSNVCLGQNYSLPNLELGWPRSTSLDSNHLNVSLPDVRTFPYFRFFKKPMNIYCEFIPGLIFLLSIFGYLVIQIFYKWVNFDASQSDTAPSLLIGMYITLIVEIITYQKGYTITISLSKCQEYGTKLPLILSL